MDLNSVWVFMVEDTEGFKEAELLGAFSEAPAGEKLLELMGEHTGINLIREFRDQEDFLSESMDGLTEFMIDKERFSIHNVEVTK